MLKSKKQVSKEELKNSLLLSLEHNSDAIDYITNEISRFESYCKYNENDKTSVQTLTTLRYIKYSLDYLDKCYGDNLKRIGVCIW